MSRKLINLAVLALLVAPGVANAQGTEGDTPNSAKLCKQLHVQQGKCVPLTRYAVKRMLQTAISECKAEREATQAELSEGERGNDKPEHGQDSPERGEHNGESRSTFRACVQEKMRAQLAELKAKFVAAVEQCKTEREADPVAFREKYGKGKHSRRAMARCVFEHVREDNNTL